ncbi:MAG: pyrroline-5-carboxylate reductase [Lachnospiraceae bacterium]|nr:pyrroline-5-carboxylate reductase [Lachnospiraceae bacterium]
MKKIGFIGAGNMGYPLLCKAVSLFGKENVTFRCAHDEKNTALKEELGVCPATSLKELAKESELIILAVKPQFFAEILSEIKEEVRGTKMLVSMAPGITLEYLATSIGNQAFVARTMPNTPAVVGKGMTAVCFGEQNVSDALKQDLITLFESVGKVVLLPERLMDASIVASGSSPAFMYLFMEALADGAVKYGIPRNQAYEMVAQTMIGAGEMLLQTGEHPGKLKDNVCSPGGTTIAGVAALEENGFRNAILKACDACYEKAMQMKK